MMIVNMAASMSLVAGKSSLKMFHIILILSTWFMPSLTAKLNAPKVLLPYYSSFIANFTLRVEFAPEETSVANCYRWRSTRPEVAQVSLINSTDGECAAIARVSAISKTPHQMTTAIVAENKVTKEALRCNVIVGEIVRLEIETTTRLLYLEDSPEELIARGFDSEGNIFSSLEGLPFEWSLVSDNDIGGNIDAHNILRIRRFSESHYTTPSHIAPLEEQGLQGDTILVEGIRTGSARCSARLKDVAYKGVTPSEVRIVVVANLMLSPPDAYVLKHAHVKYTVELLRHNSLREISMPSPQYYLEVKDRSICSLDPESSVATALEMGSTEIVLKDKNVIMSEFFPQPSAMLHVVSPGFLAFVVLPGKKWVLETQREYEIYIEVYDTDSHKIFPSENIQVEAVFPSEFLKLLYSSANGTYHRVRTLARGDTIIHGQLTAVIGSDGTPHAVVPAVKGSQDLEIYDPITVNPPLAIFPWDPVSRCNHNFTAQAEGGSGEYLWGSTDTETATVSIQGQINTLAPGRSNITAADAKNSAHSGTMVVHVLPPAQMSFLVTHVEKAVGKTLSIPLILSARVDGKMVMFTDCRQLPLNFTFSDASVFMHVQAAQVELPAGEGCTVVYLQAQRQGHTLMTVTYQAPQILLQASVTIAAYIPLKPVDPEREIVIPLAAARSVLFQGGPQPWVLDSSTFFTNVNVTKPELLIIQQTSNSIVTGGSHTFYVTCRNLGEQRLTLTVGNGVTAKNRFPVNETAFIKVVCAHPVELHLQPVLISDPQLAPCPVSHQLHLPIPVHCGKDLRVQVTLTDSIGRQLQNISSLALEWTLSTASLFTVVHPDNLQTDIVPSEDGSQQIFYYQTLRPHGKTGSTVVTATISHYKQHYLQNAVVTAQDQVLTRVSKSLALMLVEEAVIIPETISVFNHPSNKVTIEIQKGSGYFYVPALDSSVLQASYLAKSHSIVVNPLQEGSQSIQVFDLCLEVDRHPTAVVYVSGVATIQMAVQDKVEIHKEVTAVIKVLDAYGHALLPNFFTLMGLTLRAASDIVSVRPVAGPSEDHLSGLYSVTGMTVGHTTLTASAHLPNGQMLNSASKPVEVFPPLRLRPANITLITGATFQVIALGGPQPQSIVQFGVLDGKVTSVSSSGLLTALSIGTTKVVGKAVGLDPISGASIIYSQDEAVVSVVPLKGIRIHAPLSRLQTGSQMPVYAMGLTEQDTPFTFGASVPPLIFTWTLNSREVLQLKSVYQEKGIRLEAQHSFAQQVYALRTGHVTLGLEVRARDGSKVQVKEDVLHDDLLIQVFDPLQLTMPEICAGSFLLMPNTETLIHTNRDAAAVMSYTVIKESGVEPVVRVDSNGQLTAGAAPGSAFVRVTAVEDFGINQTLLLLVQVKAVSYLMLNLDTDLYISGSPLPGIPVGAVLQFSVSYHDDVGQTFHAANLQLGVRCNRYDLLHVSNGGSNNTLVVRAAEVGHTIFKVWDKDNPWVSDFVSVPVVSVISPPYPVLARGSVVCFSTPFDENKGVKGGWKSSGRALQVDSQTGEAHAVAIGQSSLSYQVSPDIVTNTEVTVVSAEKVELLPLVKFVTNSPGTDPLFIPIVFSAEGALTGFTCHTSVKEEGVKSSYRAPMVKFFCNLQLTDLPESIRVSEVFSVEPVINVQTGEHGCLIRSVGSLQVLQQLSSVMTSAKVQVRVAQEEEQEEKVSDSITLSFVPAFHVHTSELHLTTTSPRGDIHLSCVPLVAHSLQVVASDPRLEVLSAEPEKQGQLVIITVRLRDSVTGDDHLELFVDISCTITSQHHRLPVSIQLQQGQKPERPSSLKQEKVGWGQLLQTVLHNSQPGIVLFFVILATAAAVLVGYHAVVGPRYKMAATSNIFLNQTSVQPSPQHPYLQPRSSTGSPTFTSPATPSRLWSVSPAQQDTSFSLHQRSPHSTFAKS